MIESKETPDMLICFSIFVYMLYLMKHLNVHFVYYYVSIVLLSILLYQSDIGKISLKRQIPNETIVLKCDLGVNLSTCISHCSPFS